MQIATTWDIIGLAPAERLFGGMVELAMLAATPDGRERLVSPGLKRAAAKLTPAGQEGVVAEYLESLGSGSRKDDHWRSELARSMDGLTETRLRTILADLCVESGLVRDFRAQTGPVVRRLDAILDIAQVPFTVRDVQASYAALVAELAAAADGPDDAGATAFDGFLGGRFGRPDVLPAPETPAADRADELGADVAACARLLNAVLAAVDCELPNTGDVLAVRIELQDAASAATDEWIRVQELAGPADELALLERRSNMLNWALGFVAAAFAQTAAGAGE